VIFATSRPSETGNVRDAVPFTDAVLESNAECFPFGEKGAEFLGIWNGEQHPVHKELAALKLGNQLWKNTRCVARIPRCLRVRGSEGKPHPSTILNLVHAIADDRIQKDHPPECHKPYTVTSEAADLQTAQFCATTYTSIFQSPSRSTQPLNVLAPRITPSSPALLPQLSITDFSLTLALGEYEFFR
jgi:hypothetical protein